MNWAITNTAGETQFVKSLGGIDPDVWTVHELDCEPSECHTFVDGALVHNDELRARLDRESELAAMSEIEKHNHAVATVINALVESGALTADQAASINMGCAEPSIPTI